MGIVLYTGRPGSGKTYLLTRDIIKALIDGYDVYSNYYIEYPKKGIGKLSFWNKLTDLKDVKNGIICMDEAHVYMRARNWKNMSEEMERKLAQHRKDGLHIWGTTQAINRVDVIFRELVDVWYVCYQGYFFFIRYEFDIDNDKTKRYPLSKSWYWKSKKIMQSYDTLQKIIVAE